MNTKALMCAVATSLSMFAGGAFAGTVGPGVYEIENADPSGGGHGLWLAGFFGGGYAGSQWSIDNGQANVTNTSLQFDFEVTNNWANANLAGNDYRFGFSSVTLDKIAGPGTGPECQSTACDHLTAADVDYFNSNAPSKHLGTLMGLGSMSNYVVRLFVNDVGGAKPPQLGLGGSWFGFNADKDGFATWLTWSLFEKVQVPCLTNAFSCGYDLRHVKNGKGDINWLVGAQVPLPAAGWLLIGGLGGLVAMKRRTKTTA